MRRAPIVAALAVFAACDAQRDSRRPNDELIVAVPADTYNTTRGTDVGVYPVNANIYETLVRLTPEYRIEPMLATRWEFVPPNTWRFHLRTGVSAHDGSPLTARAVQWTMRRIARTPGGTMGLGDSSARVVDDTTIDITPARPNLRLVEQLAHPNWSILAAGTEPGKKTAGTGPFRLVEYVKGDHLTVERFPGYWGARPKLRRITFRFIPDPNTRLILLRSGEVDVVSDLPRESARVDASDPKAQVSRSAVGGYEAIYVNLHGAPPYDLGRESTIRNAVAATIDKTAIANDVWLGNAEPATTLIPAALLGADARVVRGIPLDRAAAVRTLDSAGWKSGADGIRSKNGRRLTLTMILGFPSPEAHKPMPEVVQAQLRRVGIEMKIVQVADNASYQARIKSGEGDLWAEAGGQNDGNPCFLPDLLFYGGAARGRSSYARLFAPGARFDSVIEGCRAAVMTADVRRIAAEAMRILSDEAIVTIPLAGTYRIWGVGNRVRGFVAHPSSLSQRWDAVSVGK